MNSNFDICYISCGCNKTPHCADWGRNGIICFGACNSVIIYDPSILNEFGKITHTLVGHKDRVNCVRWLKNTANTPENEFISASSDGTAIIWSWDEKQKTYVRESVLSGHSNFVNVADGLIRTESKSGSLLDQSSILIATASIDSQVMIWEGNNYQDIKGVQVINWNSGFCLDIKFSVFPNTIFPLLACAADDNKVYLYTEHKRCEIDKIDSDNKYFKVHVLTGHDDWVRAMDFLEDENNNLYLATASQDTYIRVYKFCRADQKPVVSKFHNSFNKLKKNLETEETIIKIGAHNNEYSFSVVLETVLAGHEGWVYGVSWNPSSLKNSNGKQMRQNMEITGLLKPQKIKLLSSSMDKSMIIWSPNETGIWQEEARVGEVGGNMLGFYGGKFGPKGLSIMGHGYQGSFHIWSFDKESKNWEPKVIVGGHSAEVTDLAWDIKGNYVLSVGSDQTTRLHAPWIRINEKKISWHEIARPQVHGYDINCLSVLSQYKFVSGAEEKVIRAFTAPNNFIENFKRICDVKIDSGDLKGELLPQGASVPTLGLSNKPVFEQMKKEGFIVDDEYPDLYFSPIFLKKPPTEENLMQNTLWPEAQKLYGHGYEIYSLAARGDGAVLASSCKAAVPEHAAIILWNAKTWLQIQKLIAHQLTVTQMSFSPNGKYLLSVSRDRKWVLFGVKEDGKSYELLAFSDGKNNLHTRVIWCCSWTIDSLTFATGSRDGKVGFWSPKESPNTPTVVQAVTNLEFQKESVTALAFAPFVRRNFHILAIGFENGSIYLYKYCGSTIENLKILLQGSLGHQLTVKKLAFRPKLGRAGIDEETEPENASFIQLASCGSDHILKIYDLSLQVL